MRTLLCALLTLISTSAMAQKECGTTAYLQQVGPSSAMSSPMLEEVTSTQQPTGISSQTIIYIPVVVHVVYNDAQTNISDAQIFSQIDALNKNFNRENEDFQKVPAVFAKVAAGANIRFVLAKVDPSGRATTGITRTKTSRLMWSNDDKIKNPADGGVAPWDAKSYLNIWVCNTVPGLLGYSSAPGSDPKKDGVVIKSSLFGVTGNGSFGLGRTAVHEVGHWLNLKHLWGDAPCGSDEVDDTPQQKTFNQGTPSFPLINGGCSANNPFGDMFMNFMDFTNDAAMMMFTQGQVARMRNLFGNGGVRQSILTSKALGEPWNATPASSTPETASAIPVAGLRLYPNPVTDRLTITVSGEGTAQGTPFAIFAADGRLMQTGKLAGPTQTLSLSGWNRGLYFVRMGNERTPQVMRFMKQ